MCDECFGLVSKGYVSLNNYGFDILKKIEQDILSFISDIEFKEYHIPALIEGEVLRKCGYFKSFPNHLTIAGVIDREKIDEVLSEETVASNQISILDMYFTPAACLHIYPMFENRECLNECITTKARVYRFEDGKFDNMTRLWDFTVREIVFIGKKEFVLDKLKTIEERALEYARSYCIEAKYDIANDYFYPTLENKMKQRMQKVNKMKRELLVNIGDSKVAIASINYHDTHFSRAFNFDNNSEIVTGCIGFGLERWVDFIIKNKKV